MTQLLFPGSMGSVAAQGSDEPNLASSLLSTTQILKSEAQEIILHLWCMADIGPKTISKLMPLILQGWRPGQALVDVQLPQKQLRSLQSAAARQHAKLRSDQVQEWALQDDCYLVVHLPHFNSSENLRDYPYLLAEIHTPPPVLMVQGDLSCLHSVAVGIVGSRNPSSEGVTNARAFSQYLVGQGVIIVSGGAAGVDRAAHEAALAAGGRTVAVLGHSLDFCYPAAHRKLFSSIAGQGALVSEFPLGTSPKPALFPRRNRIITGLSLGVCVVEAGLPSGSLVSAKWAYEQNREVFAIPGSIHNPRAKGCHSLIQQGAKLVQSGEDIMSELQHQVDHAHFQLVNDVSSTDVVSHQKAIEPQETVIFEELSFDQQIVHTLRKEPLSLDDLSLKFQKVPVQILAMTLSDLEIEGVITRDPGSGLLMI